MFFCDAQALPPPSQSALHYFVNSPRGLNLLAGIIKIPPKQQSKSYADLPGKDPADRAKITKIFTAMGTQGKLSLLKQRSELEKLGREIDHVHPLKLLGCIFSQPKMREYFDQIYNDYFKWKNFIEGFEPRMSHEALKNNLLCYLNDFAKEIGANPESLRPYFDAKDWRGLVKYLIYRND